jgi:hypothetical protein
MSKLSRRRWIRRYLIEKCSRNDNERPARIKQRRFDQNAVIDAIIIVRLHYDA